VVASESERVSERAVAARAGQAVVAHVQLRQRGEALGDKVGEGALQLAAVQVQLAEAGEEAELARRRAVDVDILRPRVREVYGFVR
jgi:hypothetical protein